MFCSHSVERSISIHALRVEGDCQCSYFRLSCHYFYPRPPGGGRLCSPRQSPVDAKFLSTPSGWRATANATRVTTSSPKFLSTPSGWRATRVKTERALTHIGISIHALRVEGDLRNVIAFRPKLHFYPRPPGGGRPPTRMPARKVRQISIHALRVEGDLAFVNTV